MANPRINPLSPTTVRLLEATDEIRVESIPTVATGVIKGKTVLILGAAYTALGDWPDNKARQAERDYYADQLLKHEAHHVACHHAARQHDRDLVTWNVACDACIHQRSTIDLDALEACLDGGQIVTFDRLQLPPQPPEQTYAALMDEESRGHGGGCGRPSQAEIDAAHGEPNQTPVEKMRDHAAQARQVGKVLEGIREEAIERQQAGGKATPDAGLNPMTYDDQMDVEKRQRGGTNDGSGRQLADLTGVAPAWVQHLIDRLEQQCRVRTTIGRSFRREHRHTPLLRGRCKVRGQGGNFFLDASGSIQDAAVRQMLDGLSGTPLLADSDCWVFDTKILGPFSVSDHRAINAAVSQCGGGTYIKRCFDRVRHQINSDLPCIFFSDALDSQGDWPNSGPAEIWVFFERRSRPPTVLATPEVKKRLGVSF